MSPTRLCENLVRAGVIDPTKVVRTALQNAASIASLLLTTEAARVGDSREDAGANAWYGRNGRDVLTTTPTRRAAIDTSATVMVANGVTLRAAQTNGGWSTLRMVERYAHVDDAEFARAVRIARTHTEAPTKTVTAEETCSVAI